MSERRKYGAAALLAALSIILLAGCGPKPPEDSTRVMFDTVVRISLRPEPGYDPAPLFRELWQIAERYDLALDPYDPESELSRLNDCESAFIPGAELLRALKAGKAAIPRTGGNFDFRIGEVALLWDFSGGGRVPDSAEILAALERMHTPLGTRGDSVIKNGAAPRLDFGGLAKGMVVDHLYSVLDTASRVERFLLDFGGNIRGGSRSGESFRIGVRDPRESSKVMGSFELPPGKACATAGDYQRYFAVGGVRYHHILNPETGRPARRCRAVTVIAPTALEADIISTALFVMGPDAGTEYISTRGNIDAIFTDSTGENIPSGLSF